MNKNKLTELTVLRKRYFELTKSYFVEVQRGRTMEETKDLKTIIDQLIDQINALEREMNMDDPGFPNTSNAWM